MTTYALREAVVGAVARGWSHANNSHKTMDPDLALAIVDEVCELWAPIDIDAAKWRTLMVELQREIKDGMVIDKTLAHIIKTAAERVSAAPVVDRDEKLQKALTLGLQHAQWSVDRSRDQVDRRLNTEDVGVIAAALRLLPP